MILLLCLFELKFSPAWYLSRARTHAVICFDSFGCAQCTNVKIIKIEEIFPDFSHSRSCSTQNWRSVSFLFSPTRTYIYFDTHLHLMHTCNWCICFCSLMHATFHFEQMPKLWFHFANSLELKKKKKLYNA